MCVCLSVLVVLPTLLHNRGIKEEEYLFIGGGGLGEVESRGRIII